MEPSTIDVLMLAAPFVEAAILVADVWLKPLPVLDEPDELALVLRVMLEFETLAVTPAAMVAFGGIPVMTPLASVWVR